ncbi:hypothetical protein PR048_005684 [Dryococelus australis]|uniref:Uncharacterized protein n=1 Tax=Dryococelus australis TaxID=614101 RepID=A0ABQ9I919_9NEOP|nr:hypothetical protein PR048_005684 [Dryococelus australis]
MKFFLWLVIPSSHEREYLVKKQIRSHKVICDPKEYVKILLSMVYDWKAIAQNVTKPTGQ